MSFHSFACCRIDKVLQSYVQTDESDLDVSGLDDGRREYLVRQVGIAEVVVGGHDRNLAEGKHVSESYHLLVELVVSQGPDVISEFVHYHHLHHSVEKAEVVCSPGPCLLHLQEVLPVPHCARCPQVPLSS